MRATALCLACLTPSSLAVSPSLDPRQDDSDVDSSAFLRRGFHSSAVLNGWVYIDGGDFSFSSGGSITYQYASTILAIDLSKDWTNSSVTLHSTRKPAGAPNLRSGGLWADSSGNALYFGIAGLSSPFGDTALQPQGIWAFTPDGTGSGSFQSLKDSADESFTKQPRSYGGEFASSSNTGFSLGGFATHNESELADAIAGLYTFDFTSRKLTLSLPSSTVVPMDGKIHFGGMQFVPNFGSAGMIVVPGGFRSDDPLHGSLIPFTSVAVYDVGNGAWYKQSTTGNIPLPRKEFCVAGVASSAKTYEILVYAGWGGNLGPGAVAFDEAYVLTLPGFHWVKADYPALHPRHGLSCHGVRGGQILTIGGVDPLTTSNNYQGTFGSADPFTRGLGIFDLNDLSWKSSYSASQSSYTPAPEIQSHYTKNGRAPLNDFSSPELEALFSIESFGVPTNSSSPVNPEDSSEGKPVDGSGVSPSYIASQKDIIVASTMGGVAFVVVLATLAFFLRRRRASRNLPAPSQSETDFEEDSIGPVKQIYYGELGNSGPWNYAQELSGGRMDHELP